MMYYCLDHVDLLELLLQHGLDVEAKDNEGNTRLARLVAFALGRSRALLAEYLLRHGADINATNNHGQSLLNAAVYGDDADVVRVLLKHGANPNKPSIDENSYRCFPVVYVAVLYQQLSHASDILTVLLAHGADPDADNSRGVTALSSAIYGTAPDFVQILLKYGVSLTADCRVQNQIGSPLRGALASYLAHAPTDRVKAQKAKDIFLMLLERGARLRTEEESLVADKRLHGWLPSDFVLDVLKRNDQAVLDARDLTDPQLQSAVISRLLDMARAKTATATAKEGYQAALALCDQAKTRAQVWNIESQCPLIYYNTGLLYGQLGEIEAAKDNFRRYLALAPNAQDAEAIRKSVGL
jgi:tetratricopeptide (TPR) repeat protein